MLENFKMWAWKLFLRTARAITLTVDDWIQRQEVALRGASVVAEFQAEVDPVASAAREKVIRRERKPRVVRPKPARLKYQHGEFVRS
jgi:hypothetical protein